MYQISIWSKIKVYSCNISLCKRKSWSKGNKCEIYFYRLIISGWVHEANTSSTVFANLETNIGGRIENESFNNTRLFYTFFLWTFLLNHYRFDWVFLGMGFFPILAKNVGPYLYTPQVKAKDQKSYIDCERSFLSKNVGIWAKMSKLCKNVFDIKRYD